MKRILSVLLNICVCISLFSGCSFLGGDDLPQVYISEVMPNNNGALADDTGGYPSWIELHNPTNSPVSLKGYTLSIASADAVCVLGDFTLDADGFLVVFASGRDYQDVEDGIVHANFVVASTGDTLKLKNTEGNVLSEITYKSIKENTSCGIDEAGTTVYFSTPTPGEKNSETVPYSNVLPPITSSVSVCINEYATSGTVTYADEDGDFVAWVELYNYGAVPVNLQGFLLSDDSKDPDKWVFPDVTIEAGGFLLVFLSDKTKDYVAGGPIHAGFNLSGKEESLTLYEPQAILVDTCPVYDLTSNLTYGNSNEDRASRQFFPKATPGQSNTVKGFDSIVSALYPENKSLVISEVAPVNTDVVRAADGSYYDYIELYNPTKEPVSLNGYRLSDKNNLKEYYVLPNVTVAPNDYYLIWCGTDQNDFGTSSKQTYLTMGLNRYGEELYLADTDGIVLDNVATGRLSISGSCGRVSMQDNTVYRFEQMTPGKQNPTVGLGGPAPSPVFSVPSGYLDAGTEISISCPGADIYYTLDGSTPTKDSTAYTGPITVSKTVTIRAIAYMDGRLPSDTRAGSYIVGKRHTLPVMFLSTDPANFFDYKIGIWADGPGYSETFPHVGANYWKDWERPIHVEYMDADGQAQLEFDAGVKIFGQYSRANVQKSLSINMRDQYGVTEVCYPFFGDDSVTNVYSELVLRAAGQDNDKAHLRDVFCSSVVAGQMDLDYMDYQPVVVYLNGEYWGLYDLREKICESYVANRIGCEESAVDMIKGNDAVMAGSYDDYDALLDYVDSHDLSKPENYRYVEERIDVQEFINYWITETFFVNTDTGNIKFYQVRDGGSKWRWVMFDYDWALYPSTHWQNYLEEIVNPKGHGVGRAFSTKLMRGLMENQEFRDMFMNSYVYHLKTTFSTDRLLTIFDEMIAEIEPEMADQIAKWGTHSSMDSWKSNVATLREIVSEQNGIIKDAFIKTLSGTTTNKTLSNIWRGYYGMSKSEVEALFD